MRKFRLTGPGLFLHDVQQNAAERAVLKTVIASLHPGLLEQQQGAVRVVLSLVTRAHDEALLVEWNGWSVGRLAPAAADIARWAMRKQRNRAYLPSEVDGEVLWRDGACQAWVDLPAMER